MDKFNIIHRPQDEIYAEYVRVFSLSKMTQVSSVIRYLFVAHAPEPDDEMNAEEEGDGVVAFGHVLLNIALKIYEKN